MLISTDSEEPALGEGLGHLLFSKSGPDASADVMKSPRDIARPTITICQWRIEMNIRLLNLNVST